MHSFIEAKDRILDSILQTYPDKFTQKDIEFLKNYKFERLYVDLYRLFAGPMERRSKGEISEYLQSLCS